MQQSDEEGDDLNISNHLQGLFLDDGGNDDKDEDADKVLVTEIAQKGVCSPNNFMPSDNPDFLQNPSNLLADITEEDIEEAELLLEQDLDIFEHL